jgi:hypothetical protein
MRVRSILLAFTFCGTVKRKRRYYLRMCSTSMSKIMKREWPLEIIKEDQENRP